MPLALSTLATVFCCWALPSSSAFCPVKQVGSRTATVLCHLHHPRHRPCFLSRAVSLDGGGYCYLMVTRIVVFWLYLVLYYYPTLLKIPVMVTVTEVQTIIRLTPYYQPDMNHLFCFWAKRIKVVWVVRESRLGWRNLLCIIHHPSQGKFPCSLVQSLRTELWCSLHKNSFFIV